MCMCTIYFAVKGDTLASYLFVIVLDYAMRKATEGREEELGLTIKQRLKAAEFHQY